MQKKINSSNKYILKELLKLKLKMENIKQSTRDNPSRCFDLPENIWSGVLNFKEFLWCSIIPYIVVICCIVALERPPPTRQQTMGWMVPAKCSYTMLTKFSRESSHQTRNATAPLIVMHTYPTFRYIGTEYYSQTAHNKLLYYKYHEKVRKSRCPRYTEGALCRRCSSLTVFFMKTSRYIRYK